MLEKLWNIMNKHMDITCTKIDANEVKYSKVTEVLVKMYLGVFQFGTICES